MGRQPSSDVADVAVGSNSEVPAIANHVCSTPNNRHLQLERTGPFRANMRHQLEMKEAAN
jgi:hypothetical protein